ncbi:MAG: EI24 domain-containing protein [Verrucomicrobiales bacterium]|nr:EI24 domain-containing protein [Verrucomicrobiales bacterium]
MPQKSTVSQFFAGLSSYLRVPGFLFKHGLWPYQLLPAVISLILTIALLFVFYISTAGFASWVDALIVIPMAWLDVTVTWTLTALVFLLLVGGFIFIHKHLILILLAPFLGKIAEETLRAVQGKDFTDSGLTIRESLTRSTFINLRYLGREILTNLLFLACGLIPVIGSLLSASGMFLTQSRFLGYGLMDFPLENKGFSAEQSDKFAHQRNGLSMGIGAGYILLMGIPFVGWMFAPTFGTVAGTLRMMEEVDAREEM